tara:strand:+ start:10151 stop:12454 length:2304 start_codon:yes stop_codon:yes gene_type:complete
VQLSGERMKDNLEFSVDISGMSCGACAASVEKVSSRIDAVANVSVNLALAKARIQLKPNVEVLKSQNDVIKAIKKAGYGVKITKKKPVLIGQAKQQLRQQRNKVAFALLLALPTLYLSMFADDMGEVSGVNTRLLLAMIATAPVYFWSGWTFHSRAWASLRNRTANMDVLVHLGTTVAFIWSALLTLSPLFTFLPAIFSNSSHVFFDGVVFIIAFILLGNWMEAAAKLKATDAIHSLMQLQPKQARFVTDEEHLHTETRDVEAIAIDSLIKVLAGETIPLDGLLYQCKASIDESTMTGEPYPVRKGEGEEVVAGTIVLDGSVFIRTTRTADDTLLSNIVELVEEAQMGKAPIQRLVDRISAVFVPVVVILALVATCFWFLYPNSGSYNPMETNAELAMMVLVSTLVIACPCALGLATPTALIVGTGVGARYGILIKGIEALEHAHSTDTLVVDKTGTLTSGKPRVSHIELLDCEVKEILSIAAALEEESGHPLAHAIRTSWSNVTTDKPDVKDIQTMPGLGMIGNLNGAVVAIGNVDLMEEVGVEIDDEIRQNMVIAAKKGVTLILVSMGLRLLGWIEAKDRIRESSKQAVKRAKQMGYDVIMLTGDREESAQTVADEVGIETVIAGVKPDEKAHQIAEMQTQGLTVAMVGDGINDAAALSMADVGLAMGAGSDIALDAADFVLLRNDLIDAVASLNLGKSTMRRIRTNLGWAFVYNAIGIPLAMGVMLPFSGFLLPPAFAAAAMSLSSVSVVGNSLLLRWWQPSPE